MNQYPILKNLLVSIMSVDVGLSEEREEAALAASLANGEYRQKLRHELEAAFFDENLSWMSLLDNESYCVFPAYSEEEAKEYIKERLWNRIVSMDS
ncbi:hypothetical protein FNU76_01660 [Chitinimonas arctica]|uniref:Uncharacterized protein n=1 Tax=Chitinimonas arctica TaxID=2594795 RepID=A0A516SAI7_9NEIS|nr:hypothetical protein [Chitinimonas arctica]QDQ25166.1 hypothetical protein FNU76_01660 [Chitinimonas arctica]